MEGWIKIHRKITELDFYFSERFSKMAAWIDLLLLATHKPQTIFIRGVEINLQPGELAWSITSLAKRWKWNKRTVIKVLNMLEKRKMIHRKSDNVTTIISIKNWDKYQNSAPQRAPQRAHKQECKECKEDILTPKGVKHWDHPHQAEGSPSLSRGVKKCYSSLKEITSKEIGEIAKHYDVNPKLVKYCFEQMKTWLAAKGRRYKNYKMALMNWVLREKERRQPLQVKQERRPKWETL